MGCDRGSKPRRQRVPSRAAHARCQRFRRRIGNAWEDSMLTKSLRLWAAAAFIAAPAAAQAAPLKVVTVAAPDVNCVFDPSCKLTVTDSVGDIVIPGMTGKAVLQSRTFSGAAGAPGAGLIGYEYR